MNKLNNNASNFINGGLISFLDNVQDVIWSVDFINSENSYVNAVVEKITGIPQDEFRENMRLWKNFVHSEDISDYNKISNKLLKGEVDKIELEYRVVTITKEIRWFRSRVWNFKNSEGKVVRIDGIAVDITAQKLAEIQIRETDKLYQKIVETSSEGVVIINKNNKIIFANKKISQLTGYEVIELINQNISRFMNPDNYRRIMIYLNSFNHNCRRTFEDEFQINNFFQNEFQLQKKDGSDLWVMISATPIIDESNQITGFLGMILDITGRKKMELELARAKNEAESANKIKSQFLANMSHEIRTPLNSIIGFTDMLYDTSLDYTQREMLHYIKTSGKSLISVINDILDFSKIESGKLEFENIEFDIIQTVYEVFSICNVSAINKKIKLVYSVDSGINCKVKGDPNRLRQVLINLVSNAVKFTSKGLVTLDVKLIYENSNEVFIKFSVKDQGIGIEASKLDKIFEPFIQADGGVTRKYGGTGLGLPIANQLIKLMGGNCISVTSELGSGSCFYFELLMERGINNSNEDYSMDSKNNSSYKKTSYQILLVEDNDTNRILTEKVLKQYNHNVISVINGEFAVEAVKSIQFDLVLMDVQMPVMDGIEATYCIRKLGCDVPIIALTANAQKSDIQNCIDAGMDNYLSKPINISELNEVITRTVEDKKLKNKMKSIAKTDVELNENSGFYNSSEIAYKSVDNMVTQDSENIETFDYEKLSRNLGGISELMIEAVTSYIHYFPGYMNDLKSALLDSDCKKLRLFAHKLKGTALNACAVKSGELLYSIEKKANDGKIEGIEQTINKVINDFELFKKETARLFKLR